MNLEPASWIIVIEFSPTSHWNLSTKYEMSHRHRDAEGTSATTTFAPEDPQPSYWTQQRRENEGEEDTTSH